MDTSMTSQGFWRCSIGSAKVRRALWFLVIFSGMSAFADDRDEEYSFNWLDPDKKIYVLQNRKFLKAGRPQISILGGTGFSNPYRATYNLEPRVSFFISEAFGLELFYTLVNNVVNPTSEALQRAAPNVAVGIREIRSQYGALLQYIPWYAKINVFNSILYFDWYLSAGGGSMQTFANSGSSSNFTQQDLFGFYAGTGHLFHITQSLTFRLDLTGAFYSAPINGTGGDTSWFSSYNFGFGLGFKI